MRDADISKEQLLDRLRVLEEQLETEREKARRREQVLQKARTEAAERALRLEITHNCIADGVVILGPDGKLLQMNPMAAQMLGCTKDNPGISVVKVLSELNVETLDGRHLPYEEMPIFKALKGEAVLSLPICVSSKVSPAKRKCLFLSAAPILGQDARALGVVVTFRDISDLMGLSEKLQQAYNDLRLRNAELESTHASLQASEKRYRTLVETMNEGLGMYDENGLMTYVNDRLCKILGHEREELIAHSINEFVGEDSRIRIEKEISKRKRGISSSYELGYSRKDKEKVFVIVSSSPLVDEQGDFKGGIVTVTDISNRKQMEEKLRHSERQLKKLSSQLLSSQEKERKRIANEIHDSIGQSLHTLRVGMEHLLHQVTEQNVCHDSTSIEEMLRIVDFAVEEVRNIYMDLRPSLLDDLGLLATMTWFFREYSTAHPAIQIEEQITVREDEIPESIKVVLFRVLQSAMDNIAQHSKAGKVDLSLRKAEGRIELIVADDGTGFDLEDILFGEALGRGLGLPSMQERVESSGGIFSVSSTKGVGSVIKASWEYK